MESHRTTHACAWWQVVETLAAWQNPEELKISSENAQLVNRLLSQGFSETDISKALAWLETLTYSGMLSDCLSIIMPQSIGLRLRDAFESYYISDFVYTNILTCRLKGLLSDSLMEILLEGSRGLDTKHWDDSDVIDLFAEMLHMANRSILTSDYRKMLSGYTFEFQS